MATKSSIRVLSGKRPIDAASCGIALALPRLKLAPGSGLVDQAPCEALALHDADFDLGHVQPARMLGCVVKLHAAQQRAGACATQHFLEARAKMGVEVVQNQVRSEEHTSELQSPDHLVCRLLLEKKKMTSLTSRSHRLLHPLNLIGCLAIGIYA